MAKNTTREQDIAAYERGSQFGAERYNAAKGRMASAWVEGLRAKGVNVSGPRQQKYQAAIAAAQYRAGNGQKWHDNWVRALST